MEKRDPSTVGILTIETNRPSKRRFPIPVCPEICLKSLRDGFDFKEDRGPGFAEYVTDLLFPPRRTSIMSTEKKQNGPATEGEKLMRRGGVCELPVPNNPLSDEVPAPKEYRQITINGDWYYPHHPYK